MGNRCCQPSPFWSSSCSTVSELQNELGLQMTNVRVSTLVGVCPFHVGHLHVLECSLMARVLQRAAVLEMLKPMSAVPHYMIASQLCASDSVLQWLCHVCFCLDSLSLVSEGLLVARAEPHSNGDAKHISGSCDTERPGAIGGGVIDADKAAHSFQEGFIPQDPSPAVLKTEFPPALEHVTEHPPLKTVCTNLSLKSYFDMHAP